MSFSNHNHKTKPQGCKFCSTKLTKEKFINKANKIHNFKYDYSLIEDTPENIYNFEKYLKKILKNIKYTPLIYFPGSTHECFKTIFCL